MILKKNLNFGAKSLKIMTSSSKNKSEKYFKKSGNLKCDKKCAK